jgi:Ca-activated chloride channel family protein
MRFIEELDGDRVGIVAFAGETMEFPMTVDYAAVGLFLNDLGPYDMPVGGTAIGRALVSAKRLLERADRRGRGDEDEGEDAPRSRVVILMTDGEDHEGDPVEAASELADAGIRVYVIGLGSRTGEPVPTYGPDGTWTGWLRDDDGNAVTTSLTAENEAVLTEVAETTGGRYFRADQGGVGIDQIRREMRRMRQEERDARRVTVDEDRYALVLLPAFLFLLLEGLLPEAWIGRRRRRKLQPDARRSGTTPDKASKEAM